MKLFSYALSFIIRKAKQLSERRKIMKRKICAMALAAVISVSVMTSAATVYADWEKTDRGYSYTDDETGAALKGWQKIGGKTYYFSSGGVARTGWWNIDGELYHFSRKGVMQTGKATINDKIYDFGKDGKLVRNIEITVNGKTVKNAATPYRSGGILMVPLGDISAALGYSYSFDESSGKAVVDDDYIQKAEITVGSDRVDFTGELEVIDMSRETVMEAEAELKDGCVYVPLSFFEEFFNDVTFDGSSASVSPSMAYID